MSAGGHVVVASDKFKGSLTAPEVSAAVASGLRRFRPGLDVRSAPVADGGDGTLDAVVAGGFHLVPVTVTGPTGRPVAASYARRATTAVVELAAASGLRRLPGGGLAAMTAGSVGTGELVVAALDAGCDEIVIGLGGSAGTDGGAGLLRALGVRLLDADGAEVGDGGGALARLSDVDLSGLDARVRRTRFVLAGDVDNPLLGPTGAAAVYGPQKGATPTQVAELDAGLARLASLLTAATGHDHTRTPGAGAAGGVGYAALSVLRAERRPGIELVLELTGFEDLLPGAQLVITGEGSLDRQSLHGKAPVGVAAAAARHGLPTVAVAGRCLLSPAELRSGGLHAGYALDRIESDPAVCVRDAARLLGELCATTLGPAWLATSVPT